MLSSSARGVITGQAEKQDVFPNAMAKRITRIFLGACGTCSATLQKAHLDTAPLVRQWGAKQSIPIRVRCDRLAAAGVVQ